MATYVYFSSLGKYLNLKKLKHFKPSAVMRITGMFWMNVKLQNKAIIQEYI
jgi:hypothetical protein